MEILNWLQDNANWMFSGVGVLLLTALVKFFPPIGRWFAENFIPSSSAVEVFPPKENAYNDEFYDHFKKCFRDAKKLIYITGEGFECKDNDGETRAVDFAEMMRAALNRGLKIIRVETRPVGSERWAELLSTLKRDFPSQFKHFVFGASSDNQLSSICVFDPDSTSDCIVEIMLSVSRRFGTDTGSLAGPGVFISNEPELARNMADRIIELTELIDVTESRDGSHLKDLMSGKTYYFAYGSNMDTQQMLKRVPSAKKIGIGRLEGYSLRFNRRGTYRNSGVASVEKANDEVLGVVWEIKSSDIAILTKIEDPAAYDRETIEVMFDDGRTQPCITYIAKKQDNFIAPESDYLELIINGAKEAGINETYINRLRNTPLKDKKKDT